MKEGFFGDLFDFDHDGKLEGFEADADFAAFASVMDQYKREQMKEEGFSLRNSDEFDEFDDFDVEDRFDDDFDDFDI